MQTVATLSDLAAALRQRLATIGDEDSRQQPEQHMVRLKEVSERIDAIVARLPQPIDPRLAHFLQRRSYDKALEMLQ